MAIMDNNKHHDFRGLGVTICLIAAAVWFVLHYADADTNKPTSNRSGVTSSQRFTPDDVIKKFLNRTFGIPNSDLLNQPLNAPLPDDKEEKLIDEGYKPLIDQVKRNRSSRAMNPFDENDDRVYMQAPGRADSPDINDLNLLPTHPPVERGRR